MGLFNRCSHVWEVHTDITESQMEHMERLFGECPSPPNSIVMDRMTARKHIQILTCSKCGKIKRYVTNI